MKYVCISLVLCALFNTQSYGSDQDEWIRINQLGYRNNDLKVAVLLSKKSLNLNSFKVVDAISGKTVMTFHKVIKT
jgi:hypothetical protein